MPTFFSHVFKDKELADISGKIDDLVGNIPIPAEPSPVENVTGKFIDQVLLKDDDAVGGGMGTDQQKLFENVAVPAERLARYAVYKEINRSVPIIKRIIKVYTSHLLQKNPVDGKCIIYREAPKVTKDDDDQIKEARKFAESVEKHFDLPKKLKNSICPKKLLYGNCFVEVVDVIKESEKVDLSKINLMQEVNQLEAQLTDVNGKSQPSSDLQTDLIIDKISELLYSPMDRSDDILEEQEEIKRGKVSEEKEDEDAAKKTEEDIMNPFLDVIVKVHDPHNIVILQSRYGTRIGYLEVQADSSREFQNVSQNISNVVGKITTLNKGGTPEQAIIDKIIGNILKKTLLQSNNFDNKKIESTLKALGEDVYLFIKRLFIEQDLGRKTTKYNKVRTRFIPVNKMVDFNVPSNDYSPYGESIVDPLILPCKLYMLAQLSNVIIKLSRAAVVRKWINNIVPCWSNPVEKNRSNSGKLLPGNAEDNPEPSLSRQIRRCNDYPEREYTQVSGNGRYPIMFNC